MEYTRLYKPYRKACDRLEELLREREEDERRHEMEQTMQVQEKEKVSGCIFVHAVKQCTLQQNIEKVISHKVKNIN